MTRHAHRPGYTLLEVLLALSISTLLMGALYVAISNQLGLASAGRDAVSGATLTRSIIMRMTIDASAAITLVDPTRYREAAQAAADGTDTTTSTGGTTTGTTGTAGATGSATTSAAGSTGSSTTAGSTANVAAPLTPLGVMGEANRLHLFVSKVPNEVYTTSSKAGELTSDLRRISYWLGQQGGLCRVEVKLITSENAIDTTFLPGDEASCMIAPEVKSVEFTYFDGTQWLDTWDSLEVGTDGLTPVGPPRAIAVRIGIDLPGKKAGTIKYYRQVIAIPAANGNDETDTVTGTQP